MRTLAAGNSWTPTLFTACNTLPLAPGDGAELAWGGPALRSVAPTLFTACNTLPLAPGDGAELAWGGPALCSRGSSLDPWCATTALGERILAGVTRRCVL